MQKSRWTVLVFLAGFVLAGPSSAPPPPSCGNRPTLSARIFGGDETVENSIPWQAMLRSDSVFCGGSLIHKHWVLTAAHCVEDETTDSFQVWLGAHHTDVMEDTTQELNVSDIVIHPEYDNSTYSYDVALVKLDTKAILGYGVGLVCLGDDTFDLPEDDPSNPCMASGWGFTDANETSPEALQEVTLPLVSHSVCNDSWPDLDASMLCAGYEEGGKDSCPQDSGGALVCQYGGKYYVEGVTSYGEDECKGSPDTYGVYAKVRHVRSFIDSVIEG